MQNLSPMSTSQMQDSPVASLYNKLFSYEGQLQSGAYPIHKKLNFGDAPYSDIYEWLVANHHIPHNATVLDAGCGVGFGSQILASATRNKVCGISLSDSEIQFARQNLPVALKNQVQFRHQSFDEKQEQHWDCIVAVESLKHCADLSCSMAALMASLKPGGTLLLVEDILASPLSNKRDNRAAQVLCSDWHLKDLYCQENYTSLAGTNPTKIIDLSGFVNKNSLLLIRLKTLLFSVLHRISRNNTLWQIYRGGFLLDAFYARNLMCYQLIKITKGQEDSISASDMGTCSL